MTDKLKTKHEDHQAKCELLQIIVRCILLDLARIIHELFREYKFVNIITVGYTGFRFDLVKAECF